MQTEKVTFYTEGGCKLAGLLRTPDNPPPGKLPVIIEGPGWLGLADSPARRTFHQGFTDAGFALFTFDYRGYGESEGERGWVIPELQQQDAFNAITYVETREELDANRIGYYGKGGIGGGHVIMVTAQDPRIKCAVAQTVVADGADWMHRMRREYEWVEFLQRVAENRKRRVLEGVGERVNPREELMVATPERKGEKSRHFADSILGNDFHLASAEFLLRYRPIDYVHRIAPRPLLITCVENDVVTPEVHAQALYERAGAPKKLIRMAGTTHYASNRDYFDVLMAQFVEWFNRWLRHAPVTTREQHPAEEVVLLTPEAKSR